MTKCLPLLLSCLILLQTRIGSSNGLAAVRPLRKRSAQNKFQIERDLKKKRNFSYIVGSDESGVGCIAGPVVCASCCLVNTDRILPKVDDSKRLTKELREEIYQHILTNPDAYVWSVTTRSNQVIDDSSLEQATQECFRESIESVVEQVQQRDPKALSLQEDFYSIVDGHRSSKCSIKSRPWKGGDEVVYSVALASILARVSHEQIMLDLASQFPEYGFETHGGYPARSHIQAIHTHGPCSVHRKSCKPVQGRD